MRAIVAAVTILLVGGLGGCTPPPIDDHHLRPDLHLQPSPQELKDLKPFMGPRPESLKDR